MVVRYAAPLATNTVLGVFTKLLFRWRGSVYKLIWAEYLVFISLYYIISFVYRVCLTSSSQKKFFENMVKTCKPGTIEMSFVLGFFVTSILSNWWRLYNLIPWPDPIALLVNANVVETGASTKSLKRDILRYCCVNLALTFCTVSPQISRRFPSLDHLVKEDLLKETEKAELVRQINASKFDSQWLPIKWAIELVIRAHARKQISSEFACNRIIEEIDKFRHGCVMLLEYEYFSVPLVYIQVVTLSVYSYFLSCLIGSQWLEKDAEICKNSEENEQCVDLYFPFMATLQFIVYMGWLKVAESLINPFGSDDDDFELNDILDRHIEVAYAMVNANSAEESKMMLAGQCLTKPTFVNVATIENEYRKIL